MPNKLTISEALGWLKTLKGRHQELIALRNANAARVEHQYNGATTKTTPEYDAKALDKQITLLAREIRLCDTAIKRTNGRIEVEGYQADDTVLGELQ